MSLKTDITRSSSLFLTQTGNSTVDQKSFPTGDIHDPFQVQKKNIRTAALIVCTFTYLIIGACIFDALEDAPSVDRKRFLERKFTQFKHNHNMTNEVFHQLYELIINKTLVRHKREFYDNVYFVTVVLGLIGYGHRVLMTQRAKTFCIFYAMLGIPMWLITFQSTGERINSLLSYILTKIKMSLHMKKIKTTDGELLMMESFLSIVILLIGACVFSKYENWSYFDSFYYGFITLTTIGFGDYVPLRKIQGDRRFIHHAGYFFFCMGFIIFGLAVVASLMNLLVIRIVTFYSQERLLEKLREEEAANQAVLLKGDVICSTNASRPRLRSPTVGSGSRPMNQQHMLMQTSQTSVCSCTCMETFTDWRQTRRNHVKRKKQSHEGRNKTLSRHDSDESVEMMFAVRRSSV